MKGRRNIDFRGRSLELPVYLDHQATTPTDARVVEAMLPYFGDKFGNPHSAQHAYGWEAEAGVETARAQIATLIGAKPQEIIFTSGATESNNIAIQGAALFHGARKRRIVTCVTEHKCVLESCRLLAGRGFEIVFLPVESSGILDPQTVAEAIDGNTALVSIMAVNNEIGVLQPIAEIGAICAARGVLFHTDAAQAVGKIPLDTETMQIDLLSLSGHKMYAPMGVGALYLRRRPRARISPLFAGGGQERGLRSGTLPTPLCVGLGAAAEIAAHEMAEETPRLAGLRDRLEAAIRAGLDGVSLNGDPKRRVAGNLNLSFAGIGSGDLIAELDDLAVSSGSACTTASIEPSYVLRAIGVPDQLAHASIRFGPGRATTEAQVDFAAERVVEAVTRLRATQAAEAIETAV